MSECRWSGWPGAYCLDCGRPDPREEALANCLGFDCFNKERCSCSVDRQFNCLYFGPVYEGGEPNFDLECVEPGSNEHNPYHAKMINQKMILTPQQHYNFIVAQWQVGVLDYWEAWRRLFNAGFRGHSLLLYRIKR